MSFHAIISQHSTGGWGLIKPVLAKTAVAAAAKVVANLRGGHIACAS
jgi:hypothetical protein